MVGLSTQISRWAWCSALNVLGCGASYAHHSVAAFDMERVITINGTVDRLEWTNPHMWLWVNVRDKDGKRVAWGIEGASPANMNRRAGWTRRSVTPGEPITVELRPFKDGTPGGAMNKVIFPDGRTLGSGGGGPPPGPQPPGS